MSNVAPATTYGALVGRVIVGLREQRGMDQGDMAERMGLSQSAWSRVERGLTNPSVEQIRRAAMVLGDSPAGILRRADRAEQLLRKQGVQVVESQQELEASPAAVAIGAVALGALIATVFSKK